MNVVSEFFQSLARAALEKARAPPSSEPISRMAAEGGLLGAGGALREGALSGFGLCGVAAAMASGLPMTCHPEGREDGMWSKWEKKAAEQAVLSPEEQSQNTKLQLHQTLFGCSRQEAAFYLEEAEWDAEAALAAHREDVEWESENPSPQGKGSSAAVEGETTAPPEGERVKSSRAKSSAVVAAPAATKSKTE